MSGAGRLATALAFATLQLCATGAQGTVIVVNSAADTVADGGSCTLREAITSANANQESGLSTGECAAGQDKPAVDTIAFAIPGSDPGCAITPGVCLITPATVLPDITNPVSIDAFTQPGSSPNTLAVGDNAVRVIAIDASKVGYVLY